MENSIDILVNDTQHWHGQSPPKAPNDFEIEIYKNFLENRTPICLFGMTKELVPLCDLAVDLNPVEIGKPTVKCNWNDYKIKTDVIIGDGILNLEGLELVDKLSNVCNRLVCRVFLEKMTWMKYAKHFPKSFPNSDTLIYTQKDIAIIIWNF